MNKEFTRMQKLAGIITEGLYTSDAKAPMEAVSHDGESKMKKSHLKKKIKEMMTSEDAEGETGRRRRMYFHVLERGGYDDIKWQGVYNTKEEAQKRAEDLVDMFPRSRFYVESSYSRREPVDVTMEEGTIGQEAYAEMGSMDEYDTQGLTNAASVVDHYLKTAYDAGSAGMGFDDNLAYEMMDHLKQFSGEMGGMNEASYEGMERMDGLAPRSAIAAFVGGAERIILALKRDGFEDDDIHDYLIELITELPTTSKAMFEAKKDKESDTEDVIVADTTEEVPAEGAEVDVTADETKVDVNMDGVPDVDTGSAESKKAFTSLVDTYNASKQLGDPKLTQMIANALTYYNKNIILKVGQPQA